MRAGNSVSPLATRLDVERTAESKTSARIVGRDVEQSLHAREPRCCEGRALDPVGEKPTDLRGEFVFVEQSAEPVATPQSMKRNRFAARYSLADRRRLSRERWPLSERAMRPVPVVVLRVDANDALEVAAADDEQPVEALPPQAADPALGVCPRPRRPHRRLDHTDALGAEDLVEVARELAVTVTDQEAGAHPFIVECISRFRACWLTQARSGFALIPARCTRRL